MNEAPDATDLCLHPENQCPATQALAALQDQIVSLQQQVITDPLTQLHNKRHFNSALETELERTRRSQQPTSLILADLDHFKHINDTRGHAVGDLVLASAANLLKSELRMIDIPCRYGGEEFAIILPSTPLLTAIQVAERLRSALAGAEIDTGGTHLKITASFGVASFQGDQKTTSTSLLQRADTRLYEAKKQGRNRVCAETLGPAATAVNPDERAALFGNPDADPE